MMHYNGIMNHPRLISLSLLFCIAFTCSGQEPTTGEKLFALKLKALFSQKCLACHGDKPEEIEGGFDMRSRDGMLRGGDSYAEEDLILGHGAKSFLYIATTRTDLVDS
jgi:hypothetical protein